jgi:hypothetical protein
MLQSHAKHRKIYMITDKISFYREPEPGRIIKRENLPTVIINRDGSAMVGDTKWSRDRVSNALLMAPKCRCSQCDGCLVAKAYYDTIEERQRPPIKKTA